MRSRTPTREEAAAGTGGAVVLERVRERFSLGDYAVTLKTRGDYLVVYLIVVVRRNVVGVIYM